MRRSLVLVSAVCVALVATTTALCQTDDTPAVGDGATDLSPFAEAIRDAHRKAKSFSKGVTGGLGFIYVPGDQGRQFKPAVVEELIHRAVEKEGLPREAVLVLTVQGTGGGLWISFTLEGNIHGPYVGGHTIGEIPSMVRAWRWYHWERFEKWLSEEASTTSDRIEPTHVQRYADERLTELSPSVRAAVLSTLRDFSSRE